MQFVFLSILLCFGVAASIDSRLNASALTTQLQAALCKLLTYGVIMLLQPAALIGKGNEYYHSWCVICAADWLCLLSVVWVQHLAAQAVWTADSAFAVVPLVLVIFGPGRRVPKASLVVLLPVVISSLKIPKASVIHSGAQQNFAYTFVLTFSTDLLSQIFS